MSSRRETRLRSLWDTLEMRIYQVCSGDQTLSDGKLYKEKTAKDAFFKDASL